MSLIRCKTLKESEGSGKNNTPCQKMTTRPSTRAKGCAAAAGNLLFASTKPASAATIRIIVKDVDGLIHPAWSTDQTATSSVTSNHIRFIQSETMRYDPQKPV